MLVMPVLALLMNLAGLLGMGAVMVSLGLSPAGIIGQLQQWLTVNDLLGGRVDVVVIDTSTGLPFVRANRVRVLAQLGDRRSDQLPDVPTLIELGQPDAVAYGWQSLSVPANTPEPVIRRLNEELVRAMGTPEVTAHVRNIGVEVVNMAPDEFNAFVRRESATWRPLIRELGIRSDS